MKIVCGKQMRHLIVKIEGDIDHHSAEEIRSKIDREFKRENAKDIIFDFSKVSFMDSSGIGMVMGRYRSLADKGGQVVVFGVSSEINRIFEISGLYKIIPHAKTLEEAVKVLS